MNSLRDTVDEVFILEADDTQNIRWYEDEASAVD